MRILRTAAIVGGALVAVPLFFTPSASALNDAELYSGDADTLRAIFYQHGNSTGAKLTYRGGSACTSTTTDNEYSASSLPWTFTGHWNDQITSFRDYNSCDVKFYMDTSFRGPSTSYVNGGTGGAAVPSGFNEQISSFRVS